MKSESCSSLFLISLLVIYGWPFGDNICSTSINKHSLYSKCHGYRKEGDRFQGPSFHGAESGWSVGGGGEMENKTRKHESGV